MRGKTYRRTGEAMFVCCVLVLVGWAGVCHAGNNKLFSAAVPSISRRWKLNETSFRAAVYEHHATAQDDPTVVLTRQQVLEIVKKNLAVFDKQAMVAADQGAMIIVFPECGVNGYDQSRKAFVPYLEPMVNPEVDSWNPCDSPDRLKGTEVQHVLSCMAKRHQIYLVVNMGQIESCSPELDPNCPTDGQYQFNTNVVYDPQGNFIARYRKHHLFYEPCCDPSPHTEVSIFQTPAGPFAHIICADLFFKGAADIVRKYGITNIAFPTAWDNSFPYTAAIEAQEGYALNMRVNLLAANIQAPADALYGSGIFTATGALSYTFNNASNDGRLLVEDLPILQNQSSFNVLSQKKSNGMLSKLLHHTNHTDLSSSVFRAVMHDDEYNFVLLKESGSGKVCMGDLCCSLKYSFDHKDPEEVYALGAFQGIHTVDMKLYFQICTVLKCQTTKKQSCGNPTFSAKSTFDHFVLEGTFKAEEVYPYLLTVGSSHLELAGVGEYDYSYGKLSSEHGFSNPFLSTVLFGRYFSKDPTL